MTSKRIRLQKVMAQAGIASRRKSEQLILEGAVSLNGKIVFELGTTMEIGVDRLEVHGKTIVTSQDTEVVYALYKPKGCVTTMDDPEGRVTIKEFFPKGIKHLFPVGRLDYDTEGLIFVTNSGRFSQQVQHPTHRIWKTYFVKLKGRIKPEELIHLRQGPTVDGEKYQPAKIKIIHYVHDKTWLEVSLSEGKNHQIKKLFAAADYFVLKIKRYQIGPITLDDLEPGKYRRLSHKEVSQFFNPSCQ